MIGWLQIVIFMILSFTYSWWFIFGVVIIILFKLALWSFYSSRPWKKVHFPMMRAYAAAAGREAAQAENEGREFSQNFALLNLLKITNPKVSLNHEQLIQRELVRFHAFYDEIPIHRYLVEKKGLDINKATEALDYLKEIKLSDQYLLVRMVVASVIEEQFSPLDRGEYMLQVFLGKAT